MESIPEVRNRYLDPVSPVRAAEIEYTRRRYYRDGRIWSKITRFLHDEKARYEIERRQEWTLLRRMSDWVKDVKTNGMPTVRRMH